MAKDKQHQTELRYCIYWYI